jgi:hypothetical protein
MRSSTWIRAALAALAWVVTAAGSGSRAAEAPAVTATHRQTSIIKVVPDAARGQKLTTFALDGQGRVIAGVAGGKPVLRVFEADGQPIADWPLPMAPEAVHAAADGTIIAGGEGRLVRLAADGTVQEDRASAQAAGARETARAIHATTLKRKQAQLEQAAAKKRALLQQRMADVEAKLAALEAAEDDATSKTAKQAAARKRAGYERMKTALERLIAEASAAPKNVAPTAAETRQAVEGLVASQLQIISISSTATEVYVACRSATGYGFDVWRTNPDFRGGQRIIESLRGCCGQMDVQANANGVYVAENTRHRVRVFGRDGRPLGEFGSRDRTAPDGFEGCCNPMNVAFGPEASVYTAESGSGRIKRFSPRGEFLELVGKVDLVPGCKKVAIAVSPDGRSVYMLDITRGHIIRMEAGGDDVEVRLSSRS